MYKVLAIVITLSAMLIPASARAQAEETNDSPQIAGALCAMIQETGQKRFLPLKKTDVEMTMSAGVIEAQVTQTFVNDTRHPLEAIYVFPLPSRAAIIDMELQVGDRIIRSVVKEREEAKKTYEAAKRAGKKTALLEQERPNIFTTSVANFLPGETAQIRFTYLETAEYQRGEYNINFPMVVGQRYVPTIQCKAPDGSVTASQAVPDAERLNPPLLHPAYDPEHRLSLSIAIHGLPVAEVESTTHPIKFESMTGEDSGFMVTLANEVTVPDCDFNARVFLEKKRTPQVTLVRNATSSDREHLLLTVFPPTGRRKSRNRSMPRDVIFLVDTSGSMSGSSIGQARAALKECLGMLRSQDAFTIVRFATDYSFFSPVLRDADDRKIAEAEGYVAGLTADGGTEMQKALDYVLGLPEREGRMSMVVFLTDGDVGNEDSLQKLLAAKLGNSRIFAFAIGSAPNEYLLRKMAEQGRGQFTFIHSHEDIKDAMSGLFKSLDMPVLTDIELEWRDYSGTVISNITCYPDPCPDVFDERPLQVVAEIPDLFDGIVSVKGLLEGKPVEYEYRANAGEFMDGKALGQLYGRAVIDDLMYDYIQTNAVPAKDRIKREIIARAIEYQLVSKFTSRVAVEEKIERQPDGTLLTVPVAVPLPRGWNPNAFFATATDDIAVLLCGLSMMLFGIVMIIIRSKSIDVQTKA